MKEWMMNDWRLKTWMNEGRKEGMNCVTNVIFFEGHISHHFISFKNTSCLLKSNWHWEFSWNYYLLSWLGTACSLGEHSLRDSDCLTPSSQTFQATFAQGLAESSESCSYLHFCAGVLFSSQGRLILPSNLFTEVVTYFQIQLISSSYSYSREVERNMHEKCNLLSWMKDQEPQHQLPLHQQQEPQHQGLWLQEWCLLSWMSEMKQSTNSQPPSLLTQMDNLDSLQGLPLNLTQGYIKMSIDCNSLVEGYCKGEISKAVVYVQLQSKLVRALIDDRARSDAAFGSFIVTIESHDSKVRAAVSKGRAINAVRKGILPHSWKFLKI